MPLVGNLDNFLSWACILVHMHQKSNVMKKYLLYSVFVFCFVVVSACKKDNTVPASATPALGGIKAILGFDASAVVPGLTANTPVVPNKCKTTAYTAGEGETAVINMSASLFPSVPANTMFQLRAAVDIDNSGTFIEISQAGQANMSGGGVCVSVAKVYPLIAGKTYIFASELNLSVANVSSSQSTGSATVLIVRQ
jgi:hypothetical protein